MKIDISLIIYVIGATSLFICSIINWILIYHINKNSEKNDCKECEIVKSVAELKIKYDILEDECDFEKKLLDIMTLMCKNNIDQKDDD